MAAENRWMAKVFTEIRQDLAATLGPACNDAWTAAPISTAAGMALGAWGPTGVDDQIARFERAIEFRFGWRRWPAAVGIRPSKPPRPIVEGDDSGRR